MMEIKGIIFTAFLKFAGVLLGQAVVTELFQRTTKLKVVVLLGLPYSIKLQTKRHPYLIFNSINLRRLKVSSEPLLIVTLFSFHIV